MPERTRPGSTLCSSSNEAQFEYGYVLVTSFDCPYEESNAFVLLDRLMQIVATKLLFAPCLLYLLYAHWPISAHAVILHFVGDFFLTVTADEGGLSLAEYEPTPVDARATNSSHLMQLQRIAVGNLESQCQPKGCDMGSCICLTSGEGCPGPQKADRIGSYLHR